MQSVQSYMDASDESDCSYDDLFASRQFNKQISESSQGNQELYTDPPQSTEPKPSSKSRIDTYPHR